MSDHTTPARENEQVEYREIADCPGYRVGDDGSVWSRRRLGRGFLLTDGWHRLRTDVMPSCRYPSVKLRCADGRRRKRDVHLLVLEAFVGPCPAGMECCHEDGDPANNRLSNLRWDTHAANCEDTRRHGRLRRGQSSPRARLDEGRVREIQRLLAEGVLSQRQIARRFGIVQSAIAAIKSGRRWAHVRAREITPEPQTEGRPR